MDLQEIRTDKVEKNPWNPNEMTEEMLEDLATEIGRVGFLQPILVRRLKGERYQIIDGEHRWLAAKKAGLEKVPAVIIEVEKDEEAKVLTINMDKLRGEFNILKYARAVSDLLKSYSIEDLSIRIYEPRVELEALQIVLDAPDGLDAPEKKRREGSVRFINCPECDTRIDLDKVTVLHEQPPLIKQERKKKSPGTPKKKAREPSKKPTGPTEGYS